MAQYSFGTIDPNTKSGTALASDLNSYRDAVNSTHSGSSAPSYVTGSMLWSDTTSADYELKMYDGAQWITIAILDATNNVARVAIDSAETSYITATTAGQIKHVIASVDTMTIRSTGLQFNIASPVISDTNHNELLSFTTTASAVNQINIANAATGGAAAISAVGGDTDIGLTLTPKGAGVVTLAGPAAFSGAAVFAAGSAAAPSISTSGDLNTGIFFPAADTIAFAEGGTEVMRIDATGNVGIGITAPTSPLHVQFSDTTVYGAGTGALDATNVLRVENAQSGNDTYSGIQLSAQNTNGNAGIWSIASVSTSTNYDNHLVFHQRTGVSSYAERMRIDLDGKVGIGTSTPLTKLHLSDASALFIQITDEGNGASRVGQNGDALTFGVDASNGSTERVRITSGGNVAIGNTEALVALHVTGSTMATGVVHKDQPAQTTKGTGATLTIAELLTGIIQYTGSNANLQLPTGTNISGGLPGGSSLHPEDMSFDFVVITTGSGNATLTTATGITLVGSMVTATGTSSMFRVRKTGTTTYTVYRIS